jgi:sugar lactone lactonase YvrE
MRNLFKSLFDVSLFVGHKSSNKENASMIRSTRLGQLALGFLALLSGSTSLSAVDLLYVTMTDNTIVTFDTAGNNGTTIAASKATFANTNLNGPRGVALDSTGNVYAVNSSGGNISKFSPLGSWIGYYGLNLSSPVGLALDSFGNLHVSQPGANTISKFDTSTGTNQGNITTNLNIPVGLAVDSSGNLFAGNFSGNTISKFNSSGTFVSSFGSSPNLNQPNSLAIDSTGNIYAANIGSNTISKFSSSGTFLSNIGSSPNLVNLQTVAIDSSGNIYAANGNKTISKFDATGNFLTSWSTGSAAPNFMAFKPITVPEPSTYALAAIATGVMAAIARRRKARRV